MPAAVNYALLSSKKNIEPIALNLITALLPLLKLFAKYLRGLVLDYHTALSGAPNYNARGGSNYYTTVRQLMPITGRSG
jgi:hypothetical protein